MEKCEKYANLRGVIRAKFGTQQSFSQVLNMHPSTLSAKLNGRTEWAYNEVTAACKLLNIPLTDAHQYFF